MSLDTGLTGSARAVALPPLLPVLALPTGALALPQAQPSALPEAEVPYRTSLLVLVPVQAVTCAVAHGEEPWHTDSDTKTSQRQSQRLSKVTKQIKEAKQRLKEQTGCLVALTRGKAPPGKAPPPSNYKITYMPVGPSH